MQCKSSSTGHFSANFFALGYLVQLLLLLHCTQGNHWIPLLFFHIRIFLDEVANRIQSNLGYINMPSDIVSQALFHVRNMKCASEHMNAASHTVSIDGAGNTYVNTLFDVWSFAYHTYKRGVVPNYDGVCACSAFIHCNRELSLLEASTARDDVAFGRSDLQQVLHS